MGLKRRNPTSIRLFTAPEVLATLAGATATAANAVPPTETKAAPAVPTPSPAAPVAKVRVSREERHRMIARAAYDHAERAGFAGDPVHDWLAAEREVDAMLDRMAS
jgi:hypothetical protein